MLVLLLGCLCLPGAVAWGDENGATEARVVALSEEYKSLLKFGDFVSFSKRMEAIRELGRAGTASARASLIGIIRSSKSLDDQVVALRAIGPLLDAASAARVADLIARHPSDVLIEALGECFAQVDDEGARKWLAGPALHAKHESTIEAALDAQFVHGDATAHERIMDLYAEYADKRDGMHVAHAAVRALGTIGGQTVRRFILRAIGNRDWRIRLAAADVMAGQQPYDLNVRGALRQLMVDESPVVRQSTARAIGHAKLDEMVPELADHLRAPDARTRAVAHKALVQVAGKDLGFDPQTWLTWWKHRGDPDTPKPPKSSSSAPTYYGLSVHSDRLLFIVDLSGSMGFPWGRDETRIHVAREELSKVLKRLAPTKPGRAGPQTLFNVIVFSDEVRAWRKGEAVANKETVADALAWVTKTFEKPAGGTYMHAALEKAFAENPNVDTIFLLTDGLATDGEPIVPEAILASVNVWNRYRRVVIHTIALTLEDLDPRGLPQRNLREIKRFMRQIANLTHGECQIVTKPFDKDAKDKRPK